VFTTSNPTSELITIADHVRSLPPPKVKGIKRLESSGSADRYDGVYEGSPDYQQGVTPFKNEGGDFVFENEWQSFRTKKDRSLQLTSVACEVDKKRVKIAVKVVDIFGNDTMTIVDVAVKK
jgi:hypothetical protein